MAHAYGSAYQRRRAALLASRPRCAVGLVCDGWALATEADHWPPLAAHRHVEGGGCCVLRPSCAACARVQGGQLRAARARGVDLAGRVVPRPSRVW